jgi:probable selenium-dependent hydroxylase accessory protein YqeC
MQKHFPFLNEKGHIISLVGAGGKTTLMFLMAKYCADNGMKVLVSTTTHIIKPTDGSYVDNDIDKARTLWNNSKYVTVGLDAPNGKISMLPQTKLDEFVGEADITFLEADGSKHMPIKVPAENEPVIIPQSDIVIAICGMTCLGKPLKDVCFRLNQAESLLGKSPTQNIDKSDIIKILTSENGSRKNVGDRDYYMILNQCDNKAIIQEAEKIIDQVKNKGFKNIIATTTITNRNNINFN